MTDKIRQHGARNPCVCPNCIRARGLGLIRARSAALDLLAAYDRGDLQPPPKPTNRRHDD